MADNAETVWAVMMSAGAAPLGRLLGGCMWKNRNRNNER